MKKRHLLFILLILFVFSIPNLFAITGDSITGKVPQLPTNVSVFVQPSIPIIYIFSPENKTYYSQSFLLNYSIKNNFTSAWYNLDNGSNVFLSNLSDTYLTIPSSYGSHSILVYANNTFGVSSNNVSFTLTQETQPPPGNNNGGGGGGGGGSIDPGFSLDRKIIESSLIPGETKTEIIKVTNLGSTAIEISVDTTTVQNFALVKEEKFKLNPKETKELEIRIFSLQTSLPGIKFGKIIFKSGTIKRELNLAVDVSEREPLFDLNVEVLPNSKETAPGKKISTLIEMTNIGLSGTAVDVDLSLSVVDFDREKVFSISKNVLAVKTNISFIEKLELPEKMPEGTYLVLGEINYNGIIASSYDTFDVKGTYSSNFIDMLTKFSQNTAILILLIISLILVILLIIILIIQIFKKEKKYRRR